MTAKYLHLKNLLRWRGVNFADFFLPCVPVSVVGFDAS